MKFTFPDTDSFHQSITCVKEIDKTMGGDSNIIDSSNYPEEHQSLRIANWIRPGRLKINSKTIS